MKPSKEQLKRAREWQAARRYDQELHDAKKRLIACVVLVAIMAIVLLARPWLYSL